VANPRNGMQPISEPDRRVKFRGAGDQPEREVPFGEDSVEREAETSEQPVRSRVRPREKPRIEDDGGRIEVAPADFHAIWPHGRSLRPPSYRSQGVGGSRFQVGGLEALPEETG
jgi:hypothetical protein